MDVRNSKEGLETGFARAARLAVLGAIAAGCLLVAACGEDSPRVVSEATAAVQPADGEGYAYFPAGFPPPEGPVEPHIEAF